MRYSGLRIGDAVTLARDKVADDVFFLFTAKDGNGRTLSSSCICP